MISLVGHQEGSGHQLVSEMAAALLEKTWRAEVRSTAVAALIQEPELARTLLSTKRRADSTEPQLVVADLPEVTSALLKSARSDVLSQSMESRTVRRSPRLARDALIELYGSEDTLRKRIEYMRGAARPEGMDGLLELADKYLAGWKPGQFDNGGVYKTPFRATEALLQRWQKEGPSLLILRNQFAERKRGAEPR